MNLPFSRDAVDQALEFARAKHGDQKYGDKPYVYHLGQVADLVYRFGPNVDPEGFASAVVDTVLQGAILHDALEDTDTTEAELHEKFGATVLNIVRACTKTEKDLCRRCAFRRTVPALLTTPYALPVKLADRLANMQHSLETGSHQLRMYVREYADFKSLLWSEGVCVELWRELDKAFEEASVALLKR